MFTMYVAIVNRIPLFLTGSPGQSKTLSMNKILDGLKNSENQNDLYLKTLPEIFPKFY
jgi:Cdc6-like AAA superfamily ATPase